MEGQIQSPEDALFLLPERTVAMGDLGLDDLQKRPPYRDPFSPAWMKLSHHHPEVVFRRMKNRYPGFRTWLKSFGTLFRLYLMRPNNFQKVHRILESSRSLFMKIFVSVTTRTKGLLQKCKYHPTIRSHVIQDKVWHCTPRLLFCTSARLL